MGKWSGIEKQNCAMSGLYKERNNNPNLPDRQLYLSGESSIGGNGFNRPSLLFELGRSLSNLTSADVGKA